MPPMYPPTIAAARKYKIVAGTNSDRESSCGSIVASAQIATVQIKPNGTTATNDQNAAEKTPTTSDDLVCATRKATNGPTVNGKAIATNNESNRDRESEAAHRNVIKRSEVIENCLLFNSV